MDCLYQTMTMQCCYCAAACRHTTTHSVAFTLCKLLLQCRVLSDCQKQVTIRVVRVHIVSVLFIYLNQITEVNKTNTHRDKSRTTENYKLTLETT